MAIRGGRWHSKLADALPAPRLPLVDSLLTLRFGAFAAAVKLAIAQRPQLESRAATAALS